MTPSKAAKHSTLVRILDFGFAVESFALSRSQCGILGTNRDEREGVAKYEQIGTEIFCTF